MISIISFVLIGLVIAFFIVKWYVYEDEIAIGIRMTFLVWIGLAFVCILPLHCEGLYRGYSVGERTGYITKIADKGIIWKTIEGQIQVGTGNMSALQAPFDFTIRKSRPDLIALADSVGTSNVKIKLHYVQWLVMPYYVGSSGYEVDSIEILE